MPDVVLNNYNDATRIGNNYQVSKCIRNVNLSDDARPVVTG